MAGRKKTSPISDYVKRSTPDSFSYPRKVSEETKQESKDKSIREINRRFNFEDEMKADRVSPKAIREYDKDIDKYAKRQDRTLDYDPYYTVRTDSRYRNRRPQRRSSR